MNEILDELEQVIREAALEVMTLRKDGKPGIDRKLFLKSISLKWRKRHRIKPKEAEYRSIRFYKVGTAYVYSLCVRLSFLRNETIDSLFTTVEVYKGTTDPLEKKEKYLWELGVKKYTHE